MKKYIYAISAFVLIAASATHSSARMLFSNETDYTKGDSYVIDFDDNADDEIVLQFGGTGTGSIAYNKATETFEISTGVDFLDNELSNFFIQNNAFNLGTTNSGSIYFNSNTKRLRYFDGTQWIEIGSGSVLSNVDAVGVFVGVTSTQYTGIISNGTNTGYIAANDICDAEFAGSHMCQAGEVINSLADGPAFAKFALPNNVAGWTSEGAPGFTSNSNDCGGWRSESSDFLGAWWEFEEVEGGQGYLTACTSTLPIACCSNNVTP